MTESNLIIVYASSSHLENSKKTAESLVQLAPTHGFNADLYDIKEFNEKLKLDEVADPVVFVCSSTGDGEVTDSAAKFWNGLKHMNKKTHKGYLENFNYAMLGLGDSCFPKFCGGPKLIHNKLLELGATCFYGPFYADDCQGKDAVIEPFKKDIWNAVKCRPLQNSSDQAGVNCFLCVLI